MKLTFFGDVYPGPALMASLESENGLSYSIHELLKGVDFSVFNLEAPLTSRSEAIVKTGPALKGSKQFSKYIEKLGFNAVSMANNHIMDFGESGLSDTIDSLKEYNIDFFGSGMNEQEAAKELKIEQSGLSVALIAFAENEWSTLKTSGAGANPVNAVDNYNQIANLKSKYDHVIVVHHGGNEFYELPSPRLKKLLRFYIDAGASAVINHHTHRISGFEIYKSAPIFYSLGNFLFEKETADETWNNGLQVILKLTKTELSYEYRFIQFETDKNTVRKIEGETNRKLEDKIHVLNELIQDDNRLRESFEDWVEENAKSYRAYIEPHSQKFLQKLQNKNLVPSIWAKRKKLYLLNLIRCESHRDVLTEVIKEDIRNRKSQ